MASNSLWLPGSPRRRGLLFDAGWTPRKLRPALWLAADRTSTALSQGMAAQFTRATNEYLSIADNAALSAGNIDFTLFGWAWIADNTLDAYLAVKGTADTVAGLEYRLRFNPTSSRFNFYFGNGVLAESVNADSLGTPANNTWYFIVAWHDATADTVNIQVNNGAVDSVAYTGGGQDTTGSFALGNWVSGNPAAALGGRMQSWGVARSVLSVDERTALYNGGVALAYDQLPSGLQDGVAYWNLDEPSSTRNDSAGSNHLTDNNTVTTNPGVVNNAVGTWDDLSGYGRSPTQATQANKYRLVRSAINGRAVVRLDGGNDYGTFTAVNLGTTNGLALVYRPRAALTPSLAVLVGNAAGEYLLALDQTNLYYKPAATVAAVSVAHGGISANTAYVLSLVRDGTAVSFYVNGAQAGTTQTLGSNDALSIGSVGAYTSGASPAEGDLAEVVCGDRPWSAGDLNRLERYLGVRHNVAVS